MLDKFPKDLSLYEKVVALNIPHDNHASDLYLPVNEVTRKLVSAAEYPHACNVTTFISQIDKRQWFDVPFAYEPYWQARQSKQAA